MTTLNDHFDLIHVMLDKNHLLGILEYILDEDPDVCRAALITFNTAAHYWPSMMRPLLAKKFGGEEGEGRSLLEELYRATLVRPQLVRTVQMGPFKVFFDEGIELRKVGYINFFRFK